MAAQELSDSDFVVATWPGRGIVYAAGPDVPSAAAGYSPGALFNKLSGSGGLYVNVGTSAESDFVLIYGDATEAEINRVADRSKRGVLLTSNIGVTELDHESRTVIIQNTGASTITLPAPTTGFRLRILAGVVPAGGCVISCAAGSFFAGSVNLLDADAAAQTAYVANGSTHNTITLNGTTKGGQVGDWIELEGVSATKWAVKGQLVCPAGSNPATPFSAV